MKKTALITAVMALGIFSMACESEVDNRPAATVSEALAVEADEDETSALETQEVAIDTSTSTIEWVGAKVTDDHTGGFEEWSGTARIRGDELVSLQFEVDTRSIFSDNDRLTGHLKSDDFFDVDRYPSASFVTTSVEAIQSDEGTHQITGNFTIRGITKSVGFPARVSVNDGSLEASAEFTIERFEFGIEYKGRADDLIRNNVLLKINLSAS